MNLYFSKKALNFYFKIKGIFRLYIKHLITSGAPSTREASNKTPIDELVCSDPYPL